MPKSLPPIPLGTQIVEPQVGSITIVFRQVWETLRNGFQLAPTVAGVPDLVFTAQTAAKATTAAYTTKVKGVYRVSFYHRKTVADGVSSSLTFTWGWTEGGIAQTESAAALTTDTTSAQQSGSKVIYADASTDLSFAEAYASNTPARMTYTLVVTVEQLA